jgi:lipopolysaccharide assembly outer membrane protein LptD (OstA)
MAAMTRFMRVLTVVAALAACVAVFAQERSKRPPETRYNFAMFKTSTGYRISAFDNREGECMGKSSVRAAGVVSEVPAGVLRLTGNVEISTADAVLQADEADYHCNTGEMDSLTNVHFRFAPQE